jgi:hypothetical protein
MSSVEKFLQSLIKEEEQKSLDDRERGYFSVPDLEASFRKKISIACDNLGLDINTRNAFLQRALQLPNYKYLSTRMIVIVLQFLYKNPTVTSLSRLQGLTVDHVKPFSDPMGVTKIDGMDLLRAFFQYASMFIPL